MAISKPFRFEIGQQVMVRPDFTRDDADQYGGYAHGMDSMRGKIVTIKYQEHNYNYSRKGYRIKECNRGYLYAEQMFQPIHINEDELIAQLITGIITPDVYNTLLKCKEDEERGV